MKKENRLAYIMHSKSNSFKMKVSKTKRTITETLKKFDNPQLSWSSGKDSLVMLILFSQLGIKNLPIFAQFDDNDYPGQRKYCQNIIDMLGFTDYQPVISSVNLIPKLKDYKEEDHYLDKHTTFFQDIIDFSNKNNTDLHIVGLRKEESKNRKRLILMNGQLYQSNSVGGIKMDKPRHVFLPVAYWTGFDVFALILSTNTPYMPFYDNDDTMMPHELRLCWAVHPQFFHKGGLIEIRKNYPDLYAKAVMTNKDLSRYT